MKIPFYDVIIVGGGIHGAGVAQAAAAAGYSVLLLEKSEIGTATSSRSSKLIHGGLRYLESGQFGLVQECLRERAILLRNAPDLVKLVPFYIPVYEGYTRPPWRIHAGLFLYKLLGAYGKNNVFRKVRRDHWQQLYGLNQQGLRAVYQYYDAQTDDSALTKAVVQSAQNLGAEIAVPAAFIKAEIQSQYCIVHIRQGTAEESYRCGVLVNAAGPWFNQVLSQCVPKQRAVAVDLVQGAHIVVNEPAKPGVFYLEAPSDQRAVFVMPWRNQTMVGTTETPVSQLSEDVTPLQDEIYYLLDTLNTYFPDEIKTTHDIVTSFAGLRVLPHDNATVFHRPRDTQLVTNADYKPRLISLVGGKLTAYRATAEKVVQQIAASLPKRKRRAETTRLLLHPVE